MLPLAIALWLIAAAQTVSIEADKAPLLDWIYCWI